jgi:hypothetical protein
MKIKNTLIGIYTLFIGVALFHWFQTNAIVESQRAALESYDHFGNSKSVSSNEYAMKMLKLAKSEALVGLDAANRNRFFIILALASTFPIAIYIGRPSRAVQVA